MNRIESIIVGLSIGFVCPACLFLTGCLIGYFAFLVLRLPESAMPVVPLVGLAGGILLDAAFLRRWTRDAYKANTRLLASMYVFFSIVLLGLCMGVPVLNVALGIVAGAYVGRRLHHAGATREQVRKGVRRVSTFTTAVIAAIASLSATIALVSPSTPSDLQRMFNGMFDIELAVTWSMIVGLIVLGGAVLILLQYWLTTAAARAACRLGKHGIP